MKEFDELKYTYEKTGADIACEVLIDNNIAVEINVNTYTGNAYIKEDENGVKGIDNNGNEYYSLDYEDLLIEVVKNQVIKDDIAKEISDFYNIMTDIPDTITEDMVSEEFYTKGIEETCREYIEDIRDWKDSYKNELSDYEIAEAENVISDLENTISIFNPSNEKIVHKDECEKKQQSRNKGYER